MITRHRRSALATAFVAIAWLLVPSAPLDAASLKPTRSSFMRQDAAARAHGLERLRNDREVEELVRRGVLKRVMSNENMTIKEAMQHPYALPETKSFLEALAAGHLKGCGEPLVVTSLVRTMNRQLRNSSPLSVHPTGMAIDLRRPWNRACRSWLSSALLQAEEAGIVEAASERDPHHYHVVVFPEPFRRFAAELDLDGTSWPQREIVSYEVQRGDNLWVIARRHGTTPDDIRELNGLRNTTIRPGQVLSLPAGR